MANPTLVPVSGIIQNITPLSGDCCTQRISIFNNNGIANFDVGPETYVIQSARLRPGMNVTAFYDSNLPIPLIFPPQYRAVMIGRKNANETIYAGYFNENLVAEDNSLKLTPARSTEIITSNGQLYNCGLGGQLLIVYYTNTTRSIPPQTTPRRIIVMC